jgi:ABC-type nitrate/sulfonate/bicarbonate transport system substrate-binding protein
MNIKLGLALAGILALSTSLACAQSKGTIRLGLEVPASIVNVPMFMALDELRSEGYDVQISEFQSPETMMLALQQGEIDLEGTSAGTAFAAIDAGFEGKVFLGMAMSDFLMVARKDLTTCESLDGRNVGVQSNEGTTGVLTARWFASECPDAKPNILIVPGSENRVAGLLAGQIDASPIDSQNTAQLMALKPGDFAPIESFAKAAVLASVYVARDGWLNDDPETVKALVAAYVDVVKQTNEDPAAFIDRTKQLLTDMDPAIVENVATSYIDNLVPVSGVQPARIEDAIAFYSSAQPYANIKTAADVATTEFVAGMDGP